MIGRHPFKPIRINLREASQLTSLQQRSNLTRQPQLILRLFVFVGHKTGRTATACHVATSDIESV